MDRRAFIGTLAGGLLAAPLAAEAQRPAKVPRIGWLATNSVSTAPHSIVEAFYDGLREAGWVEGQNVVIEYLAAEGRLERLPELAAELVRRKVDLIFAPAQPAAVAAKKATSTIPIVFTLTDDPVGLGLVASLARPAGNATGLSQQYPEVTAKRWQLLKELAPGISRVAVFWEPVVGSSLKAEEDAAKMLGVRLQVLEVRAPGDFEHAFAAAAKGGANGLELPFSPLVFFQHTRIADLATQYKLPAAAQFREFAEAGGLMAYSPNLPELFRLSARYVDKILRGVKPADLPVEQANKFELVINLKTAKALGLAIPQSLVIRADEVIQ